MADSCHFQQTEFQTVQVHGMFWHFALETISKVARIGFIMFVSVYLSSVFFLF